ncbi:unnamed protein product [Cunninghamella blakesleeana]
MPRIVTFKKRVDFPVYGIQFSIDDQLVAVGGEGCNSESGSKNKISKLVLEAKKRRLKETVTLELSDNEDCAMSVATHPQLPYIAVGINSSLEQIQKGDNKQCRLFDTNDGDIKLVKSICTSTSKNPEVFQKITRFSHTGKFLLTGTSDGKISVLTVPDLEVVFPPMRFQQIQDADIDTSEKYVFIATTATLIILNIKDGTIVQTIDSPKLNRYTQCEYRACRYVNNKLFAIVNASKKSNHGGFVCVWTIKDKKPFPLKKPRTSRISRKIISTFCLSAKGDLLAFASVDYSVGIVDTTTLSVS